jgi:hypothetical protein
MSTFSPPADIAQITLAKSSDVNAVKAATAIAFGLLPSETKLQRGTVNFAVDTGTVNAYVVALDASITSYTDGLQVVFRPLNDNTGSATINLNSLGAKSIRLTDSEPIQAGDISAGAVIDVRYSTATGFFHLTPNSAIYAHDAGVSATAAAASAVASAGSASDALTYKNEASSSASAASASQTAAGASATAAGSSAVASAGSASDALTYRNAASASATAAGSSAVASAGSASDALTYRNAAASSASSAASSATDSLNSANAAAASYDSFDDRYLGAKSSNPTVDNDGNALLTGALYWNTTSNEMRVYSGSAWVAAYLPAAGYLALSGGTMTGNLTLDAYTEKVATLATSGTIALNPSTGTTLSCAAAGTVTFTDSLSSGQSISLLLTNGSTYTINWPAGTTWVTAAGNTAPTLSASNTLVFWKISSTLYGALVGKSA